MQRSVLFLGGASLLLALLWLPGLGYPIVSDTSIYGELGRSIWERGAYEFFGMPYAKHLPFHAFLSYPFTRIFGANAGMHVLTLAMGWAVLMSAFFFVRRMMTEAIAYGAVIAILVHPGFILMTMLGSADLTFTALLITSLYAYVRAESDTRWYIACGLLLGLACLTRYNGVPFFALFVAYAAWKRQHHFRSAYFWAGMATGAALFLAWLARNFLVFGDPLYTDYASELSKESDGHLMQFMSNVLYYLNPVHNIFPFFFPFALWGLWLHGRRQPFLICAMIAAWLMTAFWWVQAIRFAFPGYVILLAFAAAGIIDFCRRYYRFRLPLAIIILLGFIALQGISLCLYTYGACNAAIDRTVGIVPPDMSLSTEGFHSWDLARRVVDRRAETGAYVFAEAPENVPAWRHGVFRPDLRVTLDQQTCPLYRISQNRLEPEEWDVVFETDDVPVTFVLKRKC